MLVACLVVIAPASWAARAGTAAEASAEVPFVVLLSTRSMKQTESFWPNCNCVVKSQ
jgi:hypothetical protein